MTRRLFLCLIGALLVAGAPGARAQSGADFSRMVFVGDSLTAGFQDGALHAEGQRSAYPVLVAESIGTPVVLPLIDDPELRVYRGPDPRLLFPVVDRVEVVHFPNSGLHLVICGIVPHFANDNMFGWVKVLP